MNIEIERRWGVDLSKIDPVFLALADHTKLKQGYLTPLGSSPIIRIRLVEHGYDLYAVQTLKAKAPTKGHFEVEFNVPYESAFQMFEMSLASLEKSRHTISANYAPILFENDGLKFELDIFSGPLEGICIVECEYDGQREIVVPDWFGPEITGKYSKPLSNVGLAFEPQLAQKSFAELMSGAL